jgi:uncharacterized membrane protein (GlpM family)
MRKNILISGFIIVGILIFSSVGAADGDFADVCVDASMDNLSGIFNWGSCFLLKTIVPFLFALATAGFIWGVAQYLLNPDNEEKRKKSKSFIIGGLIALFVMVSMFGIIKIFTKTFDVENNTLPQSSIPQFQ